MKRYKQESLSQDLEYTKNLKVGTEFKQFGMTWEIIKLGTAESKCKSNTGKIKVFSNRNIVDNIK